jgi:SAM-dependent methyltransferase
MHAFDDAFGHMLYDHMQGEAVKDVIERDDGFVTVSIGPDIYFSEFKNWPPFEQQAMKYPTGKVLDIGCGAARHALYLQSLGMEVLVIDTSPLAIFISQRRGLRKARLCSITQVNSKLGNIDSILLGGNNFGLMASLSRARWLLRRFYSLTPPTGRIIAASSDPYMTKDVDHLAYHSRNRQKGRMAGQVRIRYRYRRFKDVWFDYLFVSKKEMEDIVEGTGWRVTEYLDDDGPRYIAILEKRS